MKRAATTLILTALVATALPALHPDPATAVDEPPGDVIYVATDGDDAAAGSIDAPLATLEAARDLIRERKAAGTLSADGATVYLREGSYQRSASFALGAEDSGTADAPIVYRSYPGEVATLTGGQTLSYEDFRLTEDQSVLDRVIEESARDDIREIDLAALGIEDYGQLSRHGYWKANDVSSTPPMELYIDGQGMTLARWPNAGAAKDTVQMGEIIDPGPTRADADLQERGGTFTYTYDRPQHWTQAEDVWLDGIFGYSWEWSYNKIEAIDTDAKTITLRYGEMSGIMKSWFPDFHFAQNLLEELDAPGEYYIDRAAGKLYLVPNAAFLAGRGAPVVTTLDEPMIRTDGASHITFDDLVLEYGRATAAVILGGSNVTIQHSDIRNFTDGGVLINSPGRYTYDGIPVNRGGTDHAVIASELSHIGGVGVVLQGGDKTTLTPGNNSVQNSEIHDFAYYHKAYNPGVMFDGVGNVARGNEIHDAPHPGIIVHGNDHLFEQNEVYDVCKTFHDLGAIYMNSGMTPQQRGHVFRQNYFHDIGAGMAGVEGIYADNFTWDLTIEKNIFVNMGNSAIKSGSADYIEATNNIFVDANVPYDNYELWMGDHEGNVVDRSYMPEWEKVFAENDDFVGTPYLEKYPELAHFFEDNHYFPDHSTFAKNVVWNPTVPRQSQVNAQGARDVKELLNYDSNWVSEGDPGFVDAANGDYRLTADAAVFAQIPGFEDIGFDEIGTKGHIGQTQSPESVPLEAVAFDADAVALDVGKEVLVRATPLPWNADDARLVYSSADESIATVDNGKLTGMAPGSTTVTVTAASDAGISDTIEVVVGEGDGVLHFTDFEDGSNGWPTDPNRSIVAAEGGDHVYRIVNGANSQLPRDFTSFVLDFDVTTPTSVPANAVMIVYNRNSAGGGYIRYRNAAAGPTWTIFDNAWQTVGEVVLDPTKALPAAATSHVRIAVQDGVIRIVVNGEVVLEGTDPAPGAAGKVGFYTEGFSHLDFDDVGFSISAVPVDGISLDAGELALQTGERRPVIATVSPQDASDVRVTWSSSDPAVASVTDGIVAAIAAGEATITATSVADPSISATAVVTVADAEHPTIALGDQLSDAANWTQSDKLDFDQGTIRVNAEGVHGYETERFGDGLLEFDATFGAFDGGWYGFQVRSDQTGVPAWQNSNTGYLVVIKEDTMEFQSWSPGQTMLDVIPNTTIEPGSTHRIAFGAIAEDAGTRIVLQVDGKTVWNRLDARENLRIGADGFFNVYHYAKQNSITLTRVAPPATVESVAWAADAAPKTKYLIGEELDVTGMILDVTWSDGSTTRMDVTAEMVTGFDSSRVRPHQKLTVAYGDSTVELTVSIKKKRK
ncbi:Ig-like domain-containing protein [Microbacterium sp. CIAB417]|uniref:Ig-like domain-containing protein n=1 Tax=Microbacterium sp. CIAB417 TaxID=2860287 RepID=UPI001FAE21F1|nr:Ig-like domain-containing protein [Microbacterium sp. CIAB417]